MIMKHVKLVEVENLIVQGIQSYASLRRNENSTEGGNKIVRNLAGMIHQNTVLDNGNRLTPEYFESIFVDTLERMWIPMGDTAFNKMGYTSASEDFLNVFHNLVSSEYQNLDVHCSTIM